MDNEIIQIKNAIINDLKTVDGMQNVFPVWKEMNEVDRSVNPCSTVSIFSITPIYEDTLVGSFEITFGIQLIKIISEDIDRSGDAEVALTDLLVGAFDKVGDTLLAVAGVDKIEFGEFIPVSEDRYAMGFFTLSVTYVVN